MTERAVIFEHVLPGSAERVWRHLTDSDLLPVWFGGEGMSYSIEPREGGVVRLADGHIRGVVTRWNPPRLISYTWNVFDGEEAGSAYPESHVSFVLEDRDGEVLLTLTHRPIPDAMKGPTMMGWHTFFDLLADMLAGRPVEARDTAMRRNADLYGVATPATPEE